MFLKLFQGGCFVCVDDSQRVELSLKMLLLTSLCVLAVIQTSSSQPVAYELIEAKDEIHDGSNCATSEELKLLQSEVITVLSQLQKDVAEMKETVLRLEGGPIDSPAPEPESISELTSATTTTTEEPTTTTTTTTPEPRTTTTTTTTPEPTTTTKPKPGELEN